MQRGFEKAARKINKGIRCLKEHGIRYTWKTVLYKCKLYLMVSRENPWKIYKKKDLEKQSLTVFPQNVKFSIVVPLYNTPKDFLCEMIESVRAQTYGNWELCMADGSDSEHEEVEKICRTFERQDERIRYRKLKKNSGISENTNACLEMVSGDYIGLFDHDDLLHPAALYEMMCVICREKADFIYTDEATFQSPNRKKIISRNYKPDFAPDMLRSINYICHFTCFSKLLLERVGKLRKEFDGAQDHDLFFRLTEQAGKVVHIPKILYFWRGHENSVAVNVDAKNYAALAGIKAVSEHLKRIGLKGTVSCLPGMFIYRIQYELTAQPKISILIPNQEHKRDLEKCLDSIFEKTSYPDFEILIIENNSKSDRILAYYREIQKKWSNVKVIIWKGEFNCSAMNNFAVSFASGQYFLLLDNNTEIITADWLQEMLMFAQRKDVGAVGAKLYYPDDMVQHGGIILGGDSLVRYAHKGCPRNHPGYMGRMVYAQNLSAVSGACLMVRRDVWEKIGGLDEKLAVCYNDVDFCIRIRKEGFLIVWTPFAELYHYELKGRVHRETLIQRKRMDEDQVCFYKSWFKELFTGDSYDNSNLT